VFSVCACGVREECIQILSYWGGGGAILKIEYQQIESS
jgi:hypothetical protein